MVTRTRAGGPSARRVPPRARRATVRLQLAGAPQLQRRDGTVRRLERREAALLTLIAIEGPTPRGRAAALLWGDADGEKQRSGLRQRLFQLRRRAGCEVIPAGDVLALARSVEHDLADMALRLADDPDAARGELLGELDYSDCPGLDEWVGAARERWRSARLQALAEIAARLEAAGRVAASIAYAERLVSEGPTLEHAHRRVMRLHYLRGDRAAALGAFERCRHALTQQLGVEPSAETLQLARLIEGSGTLPHPRSAPVPIAIARPPRLVGRDVEWAQLNDALTSRRSIIVVGEPGIGKTRLLSDHCAGVAAAISVDARPGDARIPYAVIARTLRAAAARFGEPGAGWQRGELARVVPEFGAPCDGRLDAATFTRALCHAFSGWASAGLALIVVDDVQYADDASLAALPELAGAGGPRIPWCLGCRSGELPAQLAAWCASADRDALAEMVLAPLQVGAIEVLLASLELPELDAARWAPPLWRHTGGNPLFVLETLRALIVQDVSMPKAPPDALPTPRDIGALIERRLSRLGPGALNLARVVAIAGQDFGVELASHVIGRPVIELTDDWHKLETEHVIRERAFAHDLVAEAVLRTVPTAIAQTLHRAVAVFLQSNGAAPARVASHWRDAHVWPEAAAAFEAAASDALRGSRREDELHLLGQAIACAVQARDRAMAFRLRALSVDTMLIVRPIEAALALTEQLVREATNDAQRLEAALRRAHALLMAGRFVDAVEMAADARTLARGLGATRAELDALRFEALGLANSRRAPQAVAMLQDARVGFEQSHELLQRYKFATDFGHALGQAGRWGEAIGVITSAIELSEQLGDVAEKIVNLTNLSGALAYVGRMAEAVVHGERSRALRDRVGIAVGAPMAHNDMTLGMLYVALGRYREALQAFEQAGTHFRAGGAPMWSAVNENHRALALLHLGQAARALKLLTPDDTLPRSTRARRLTIRARAEQARGRSGAALLQAALELLGAEGSVALRIGAELDLARELAPDEAVALSRRLCAEAQHAGLLALAQNARVREVDALMRANDGTAAAAQAQAMLEHLAGCHPSDLYVAEAWWVAYRALQGSAHTREQARQAMQCGVAWIQETAARHVPGEFRDSFLNRNPLNRALLAAATRVPA